jgi:hypothetical protein
MPRVELLRPPSMAPPTAGSTYAYLSLFGFSARPSHLLEKPWSEPLGCDIAREFVGTCCTPVLGNRTEAYIRVPRMFKSHVWPTIW